jgi:O-antigen ligase
MDVARPSSGASTVAATPATRRWRRPQPAPAPAALTVPHAPAVSERFGLPFHLFSLLTFSVLGRPNDYLLWLVPFRIALVFTILTIAATVLQSKSFTDVFKTREAKLYLFFYASMVIGIPIAVYRPGAFDFVITKYVVNLAYFFLFLIHVDSLAKLRRIASILVLSVFLFTVFGLGNGQFIQGRYDTGSRMFDPNDVAFVEVSLLGFALWVLVGRFPLATKALALVSVLAGVLLTLYTASRGGLLGLLTFLLLFLWLKVPKVSRSFKTALLVGLIASAAMNLDKINLERYSTLGSLEGDYNLAEGGRADIWERAFRLFLQNPVTGVGVDGFAPAVFQQRRGEGVVPRWQAAHSAYVLVLTETGILGGAAFFLLIVTTLRTFNGLRRRFVSLPDPELAVLPGVLLVGFAAQLVAAIFLSQAYSMFFTLAFAVSGALNRMTANASSMIPSAQNVK